MGQRYVQQFYTARSGELGDAFISQKQIRSYYSGLYKAENVDIDITGTVSKRPPFRVIQEIAPSSGNDSYRIISLSYSNTLVVRENIHIFFIFGERIVHAFRYSEVEDTVTFLFSKVTDYSADLIEQCDICAVPNSESINTVLDNAFVFANKAHQPFAMCYKDTILNANDIDFTNLTLENIPRVQFGTDDRTGTVLGTGNCSLELKEGSWVLTATNPAFTIAVKQDWVGVRIELAVGIVLTVVKRVDDKTLHCDILKTADVDKINAIAPADITFSLGYEPIVGGDKGWFSCCGYYAKRLCFGGTEKKPLFFMASAYADVLNFRSASHNYTNGGMATYIAGEDGDCITSIEGATALHVFTQKTVNICKEQDISKDFLGGVFTQLKNCGSDKYTQTPQLPENGVVFLNSATNQLNYVGFGDQTDAAAYRVDPVSTVLPDGIIDQYSSCYNLIYVENGNIKGRNIYFINSDQEIVKVVLQISEEVITGYTRYVLSSNIKPYYIFNCANRLFIIAKLPNGKNVLALLDDDDRYIELPSCDFYTTIQPQEDGSHIAPDWFPKDYRRIWGIRDDNKVALPCTIQENGKIVEHPSFNGRPLTIGVPIEIFVVTLPICGNPETINYGIGKSREFIEVRFGNVCFSDILVGVTEGNSSNVKPMNIPQVPKIFGTISSPAREAHISDIRGSWMAPMLALRLDKPAPFRYSCMEAELEIS